MLLLTWMIGSLRKLTRKCVAEISITLASSRAYKQVEVLFLCGLFGRPVGICAHIPYNSTLNLNVS